MPGNSLSADTSQLRRDGSRVLDAWETCQPKFTETTGGLSAVQASLNGQTANALSHLQSLWSASDIHLSRRLSQLADGYRLSSTDYSNTETKSAESLSAVTAKHDHPLNLA